ncbi:hypothetical protein MBANPS3_011789 [Mucor bainieri]
MMSNSPKEDNSPSASFQKLCQNMLDGSSKNLTKKNVEDFRVILHMIMHECSKANIETGKHWVFEHCHSPAHVVALMDYIYSLTKSRSGQDERIHMLYLINDVVYHISRKQLSWMKDAILPLLTPLLKLVYDGAATPEFKAKVTKVINFWYTKKIFDSKVIDTIQRDVTGQLIPRRVEKTSAKDAPLPSLPPKAHPLSQQQKQQHQTRPPPASMPQHYRPVFSPAPAQVPVVEKPYFELPAGLMLLSKSNSYEPLDPDTIKVPYARPMPTEETIAAVDDFYAGLELVNADDVILNGKHGQNNKDTQGWERGYLDGYREALLQQKRDEQERQKLMGASKHYRAPHPMAAMNRDAYNRRHSPGFSSGSRSRSRSRSPSRRHGRNHGRSGRERSYSYSRSRSRSYSPDYRHHHSSSSSRRSRRSYSRSSSRSPPSHYRGGGRRGSPTPPAYRDRSPPRGRSPSGRGRRPSPPRNYHSRPYDHQRRHSPSPPSSSSYRQQPASSLPRPNASHAASMNPTAYNAPHQYPQSNRGAGVAISGPSSMSGRPNVDSVPPVVPAENRYMGLGNKSAPLTADEFDSFRKNKSQAFSNREPPQPFTCYKCNTTGHLARDCTSL